MTLVDEFTPSKTRSRGSPGADTSRIRPPSPLIAKDDALLSTGYTMSVKRPLPGMDGGRMIVNPLYRSVL
jgi:hypothetical protein